MNTVGQLVSKMQDRSEDVRRASVDAIVELAQFGTYEYLSAIWKFTV